MSNHVNNSCMALKKKRKKFVDSAGIKPVPNIRIGLFVLLNLILCLHKGLYSINSRSNPLIDNAYGIVYVPVAFALLTVC